MAKKNDAAYEAFLADLKTINPQVEEILKDEKVSTKLREGVLARAEFSSQMDALDSAKAQFEADVLEARNRIEGWKNWYGEQSAVFAKAQDELKAYKENFGDLSSSDQKKVAAAHGLSVEDFDKRLNDEINKRDAAALKFVDDLTDLKIEHRQRFGEKLDTQEVYKIAGDKQLPLDIAYKVYIADKEEAERQKKYDEDMKRAREEGAAEARANLNLPIMSNNPDLVHVLDVKDVPRTSSDRVAAAVAAFTGRK